MYINIFINFNKLEKGWLNKFYSREDLNTNILSTCLMQKYFIQKKVKIYTKKKKKKRNIGVLKYHLYMLKKKIIGYLLENNLKQRLPSHGILTMPSKIMMIPKWLRHLMINKE